jgi:phosphoribosyl 1,2-cyclic phosphate phosphodiesterase
MSRAIVLGSGTSNGVPMLGVRYSSEFLANPRNHRTRCSLLLQGPKGNVLVDCTPEMRLQLLRANVFELDSVIITHTHADHIMGMDDLRSFCIMQKRDMPVYTLPRYQEDIRRIFSYAFQAFPTGIEVPRFDLRDIFESSEPKTGSPDETSGDQNASRESGRAPQIGNARNQSKIHNPQSTILSLCGLEIQPFLVEHGDIPVIALRVNNFAYITDVGRIPDTAWNQLQGLDTLILDAVRIKPHVNHFHLDAAIEIALKLGAKKTYFTHLSHDYDHDVTNSQLPDGIELAWDGLEIEI